MEAFQVEQIIEMLEQKLVEDSNSCEFEYCLKLKEELETKLKVYYGNRTS